MDRDRVQRLLRFALARASQEGGRALSKTQLTKLIYIADLEHARRHDGATYTGIRWQFLHFGPWAQEVSDAIDEVVALPEVSSFKGFNEDEGFEWKSYRARDWDADQEELHLSFEATAPLARALRQFSSLPELLQHVYQSEPMLHAAPGEELDFTAALVAVAEEAKPSAEPAQAQSKTQQKKRREKLAALKKDLAARMAEKRAARRSTLAIEPKYDEVFVKAVEEMDREAEMDAQAGTVEFDESIWKSGMRKHKDED